MVDIREISAEETYEIRLEVLRKGIDLPADFSGDFDIDTFHLGVFEDTDLMGICSFMKTENPIFETAQYQLRGMATKLEVRGKGYGKQMLLKAFDILKEKEVQILWCNAREVAFSFYLKLGFIKQGNMFDMPKIGKHYCLFKKIEH